MGGTLLGEMEGRVGEGTTDGEIEDVHGTAGTLVLPGEELRIGITV